MDLRWQSDVSAFQHTKFLIAFLPRSKCLALCNSKNCSMPGLSVLLYLLEFAEVHLHWVGDAIQPSHPLPPFSPFAFNFSQHQGLFQCIGSLHQVAKLLDPQLQHQSVQWIFRVDSLLGLTGLISLQSNGHSRIFSSTTIQKHQFFSV